MSPNIDAKKHAEFLQLMDEMEQLGFWPVDVARKLNKTTGAISQYTSGTTNPSDTVLELLRHIVADAREGSDALRNNELYVKLVALEQKRPAEYQAVKGKIDSLYEQIPLAEREEARASLALRASRHVSKRKVRGTEEQGGNRTPQR
jgi:transcriptional regulator with XRE-family HTH domain